MICYAAHTDAQLRKLAPEDPEAKAELVRRGLVSDPHARIRSRAALRRAEQNWGRGELKRGEA